MKHSQTRPLDKLEAEMLRQAVGQGGHLNLDFTNPVHYRFYVNSLGGEKRIQKKMPRFYAVLQQQRNYLMKNGRGSQPEFLADVPQVQLDDYEIIAGINAEMEQYSAAGQDEINEKPNTYFHIMGRPTASYSTLPVTSALIKSQIVDCQLAEVLTEDEDYVYSDAFHQFSTEISTDVDDKKGGAMHPYRTASIFTTLSALKNGGAWLTGGYACSTTYSVSAKHDIKSINLLDPVIRYASGRAEHKSEVCVSYKRDGQLPSPDYSYDVDLPHVISDMPVHMAFSFTVELRNNAYFRVDERGSYFDKDSDPQIYLYRFDNDKNQPISAGRASLYQDWIKFTRDNVIPVGWTEDNHVNKLQLTFPVVWKSNLRKDDLFDISTYTYFSAHIAFNTCNTDTPPEKFPKDYHNLVTSVFVRFQANPDKQKNPTDAGVNEVHVAHIFFQWGCVGEDTLLETYGDPIAAKDVKIGTVLITRDGSPVTVKNIYTGTDPEILHLVHEKGEIGLSAGHTVFDENGTPMTAGCVVPGISLLYRNPVTGNEESVKVISCRYIPYGRTVYNFEFDQPRYLISDGLLIGDYGWQQKIRKHVPALAQRPDNPVIRQISGEIEAFLQRDQIETGSGPAPVFSDRPECPALHYFAVKALARYGNLYTEEEAQSIAEYCQYLSDNATTGGLRVDSISEELNAAGLWTAYSDDTGSGFIVPNIPTAMEKWYSDKELKEKKPWLLPPDVDCQNRTYDMIDDVLAPFHYPRENASSLVGFDSFYVEKLLLSVQLKALEDGMTLKTRMAMGIVIHLLLDSMMHEGFTPERSFKNLGRVGQVISSGGSDITGQFPPYLDYPFEKYSKNASYPAGIQQNGEVSHFPAARYEYTYPKNTGELDKDSGGYSKYTGYHAPVNPDRYVRACKRMMQFLTFCKNRNFDEVTWNNTLSGILQKNFYADTGVYEDQKRLWTSAFKKTVFQYDKKTVYSRMIIGDSSKSSAPEQYEEFFQYTLMLYRLKKGESLLISEKNPLLLTYDLSDLNTLSVTASVAESEDASDGLLMVTISEPATGMILQEESCGAAAPVTLPVELDITGASEKGTVYRAVALWTPYNPENADPVEEQILIPVEGWKNNIIMSCDYTLISKHTAGEPVRKYLKDTVLHFYTKAGYEIVGKPENAVLKYPAVSGSTVPYAGNIFYEEGLISFPDECAVSDGGSLPLSLDFSCTVSFRKTGNPKTGRKAVIHFISSEKD